MDSLQFRINTVFDALDTNANAFGKKHGIHIPTLYNLVKGDREPRYHTLVAILNAEPAISAEYLLRGEGSPLRNLEPADTAAQIKQLQDDIGKLFEKRLKEIEK